MGFQSTLASGGADGSLPAVRETVFDPVGKTPWRRGNGNLLPVFFPREFSYYRSLVGHGVTKSDTTGVGFQLRILGA